MEKKSINKLFLGVLFLGMAYLSFLILKDFLLSLFLGGVIAYALYPLYTRLVDITGSDSASAVILSISVIVLILSIASLIVPEVLNEINSFYRFYEEMLPAQLQEISNCTVESEDIKCRTYELFNYLTQNMGQDDLRGVIEPLTKSFSAFISNLPNMILQVTIILFSIFYFLQNGKHISESTIRFIPLKVAHKEHIRRRIDEVLKAVILGNLLTAFIEGVAATILFVVLDVNMAFLLGLLVMFFALIPPLGAMLIWGPVVLILLVAQEYVKALILLLSCLVIMGYVDNVARPRMIGRRVKLSTLWVLLGVLGGLASFGFVGIILGPLILSLFVTVLKIFGDELEGDEKMIAVEHEVEKEKSHDKGK